MSTTLHAPKSTTSVAPSAAPPAVNAKQSGPGIAARVLHAVPNLLVFALLGGAFYVGHRTNWQLPKYSELFGMAAAAPDDWCVEHLVPDSQCVECKTDLMPRDQEFGFCATHGVTECVICHPELGQSTGEPRLPQYDTARAISLIARPENNSRNTLHKGRVQFASVASADKAGIEVDVVQELPMTESVVANGEIRFDPTRVAHLSSRAGGTVAVVFKQVGDTVHAGDVLAVVDAVQISQAKSRLLQAVVQRDARHLTLRRLQAAGDGVAAIAVADANAAHKEAEVAVISARQALVNLGLHVPDNLAERDPKLVDEELRFLGIPQEVLSALPPETRSANLIALRAPHDGMIVAAEVVAGEVVDPADVLFTVADPSHMWLTLHVRQEDARYVAPNQEVVFHTDSSAEKITGRISWISPTIDPRTRTLQARVVLDNSDGRLKDNTFGTGDILLRQEPKAVVVPRAAVQSTPDAKFVFVRGRDYFKPDAPKVFYPRQVRVGARDDQYVELLAGVLPGEVVATEGSAVVLAQLQRSNLGAGCGCHEK
jgi:cobalt-zinc-cadmium efflux system membrane fusion protein